MPIQVKIIATFFILILWGTKQTSPCCQAEILWFLFYWCDRTPAFISHSVTPSQLVPPLLGLNVIPSYSMGTKLPLTKQNRLKQKRKQGGLARLFFQKEGVRVFILLLWLSRAQARSTLLAELHNRQHPLMPQFKPLPLVWFKGLKQILDHFVYDLSFFVKLRSAGEKG